MRLAITRLARVLRQQADTEVSPTGISALATIERAGTVSLGELATHERVQPPTVTAAVKRLEEQGLVVKTSDSRDRRIWRVSITPAGAKLLARSRSRKNAFLERHLRNLDPSDRAVLERAAVILEGMLSEEQP